MSRRDHRPDSSNQGTEVARAAFLDSFECLGADCEDSCCGSWSMVIEPEKIELYRKEAPELLDVVADDPVGHVMRRDAKTDRCVALDYGTCRIQKEHGTDYQGDACHFFPRITRRLGDQVRMSATTSCPEIARRVLFGSPSFSTSPQKFDRLPLAVRDVLPSGLAPVEAQTIIDDFINIAGDPTVPPERSMVRIINVALSLTRREPTLWAAETPGLIDSMDDRLATPEPNPMDPFRLMLALAALSHATSHPKNPRFMETFSAIEAGLGVKLDWDSFGMTEADDAIDPDHAYDRLTEIWTVGGPVLAPVMRRWLQAEIHASMFPFAGLGRDPTERATIMGIRFATFRLALMCHVSDAGIPPEPAVVVRIAQSLARLLNHLADPELALAISGETGWTREARLRGLLDDQHFEARNEAVASAGQNLPDLAERSPDAALVA